MKSAFLQADSIEQDVKIYAILNRDIRRRLSRLIGLRDHEILKVLKPSFGDVRAPRQWYGTADRVNQEELNFYRHKVDKCLYLSVREAKDGDEEARVFQSSGTPYVVDGVLGVHVDDLIGG